MSFLNQHQIDHPDPLMRPHQSVGNKIKRALWGFVWLLLCRTSPKPMHQWRCFILKCFGANLGKNNFIYPSAKIWAPWLLETGDVATIAEGVNVYNVGGIYIGHHSIISEDALLCGATHNYQDVNFSLIKKKIVIQPNSWICARAVILPGVECGEGSVLGAAAVATKSLDAWTVYAGNPARPITKRNQIFLNKIS